MKNIFEVGFGKCVNCNCSVFLDSAGMDGEGILNYLFRCPRCNKSYLLTLSIRELRIMRDEWKAKVRGKECSKALLQSEARKQEKFSSEDRVILAKMKIKL